jgi:hypothetical protein
VVVQIPPGYMNVFHPIQHLLANRTWGVVIGYDIGDFGGDNVQAVTAVDTHFRSAWLSQLDNSVRLDPARAQIGNDGPPLTATSTLGVGNGTRSIESPPPNVALGVTKRTLFGGRAYRGRMYIPSACSEGEIDELGNITGARITALTTAVDAWLDALRGGVVAGDETPMVLLHGPPAGGGNPPPPTLVQRLQPQRVVRTQRRRLRS